MLKADGWAKRGWVGTLIDKDETSVVAKWDNGQTFCHSIRDVQILDQNTSLKDPNIIFLLRRR